MEACSSFESDSPSPPPKGGGDGEGGRNLRWELSFSILDCKENKKRILFDSPPLPIDASNNSYDWRDIHINLPEMSIMHRELITLHMYLHPIKENGERGRILWFTFCMQYTSLLFHMSNNAAEEAPFLFSHYDQFDTTTLNLLITGKGFYNNYNCRCAKFQIHHATLTTCAAYLQHLIELEQRFRIVCLAELSWRDSNSNKLQKAPLLYLSRPQRVQSINGKNRLYVWTMANTEGNKNQFQGLVQRGCHDWHKQVEDHDDLVRLRMEPPMTGAKHRSPQSQTEAVFIPDNEAFTNTSMAFPVHVKPGQSFTLKFFNMALDDCAKCGVEVVVKWNDYIHNTSSGGATPTMLLRKSGYKRFSLDFLYKQKHSEDVASTAASKYQRMIIEAGVGLTVEIEYESSGNDLVTVYGVHLNVLNYHYTLQFLHLQALKSI